jgi:IS605 OrfB family transposase
LGGSQERPLVHVLRMRTRCASKRGSTTGSRRDRSRRARASLNQRRPLICQSPAVTKVGRSVSPLPTGCCTKEAWRKEPPQSRRRTREIARADCQCSARRLAQTFPAHRRGAPHVIALEDLRVVAMTRSAKGTLEKPGRNVRAKSGLNRVVLDASFGLLRQMIESKAVEAGIAVVAVAPKYSSQTCSRCGHVAAESRRERRFACLACSFTVHADVNAALEIRRRAQSVPAERSAALAVFNDPHSEPHIGVEPITLCTASGLHDETPYMRSRRG